MFIAILFVTMAEPCSATCASAATWVWPESGSTIPINGRIVLYGYGSWQKQVQEISRRGPVFICGSDRLLLMTVAVNVGQMDETQVILKPQRELPADADCELHLLREDNLDMLSTWVNPKRKRMTWHTSNNADSSIPEWTDSPQSAERTYTRFGCGPAAFAYVRTPVTDREGPVAVQVEVQAEGRQDTVRYLLDVEDGKIAVGHGMCGGPFVLDPGVRYFVTMTAVDLAGNMMAAPLAAPLQILGPSDADGK